MTRPAGLLWLAPICALAAAGAPGAGASSAPAGAPAGAPSVGARPFDGGVRLEAVLPGRLVSYALRTLPGAPAGGAREILLLVAPPRENQPSAGRQPPLPPERRAAEAGDAPCPEPAGRLPSPARPPALYRLDPAGEGRLSLVSEAVPPGAASVGAADVDGDGVEEILLGGAGAVHLVREAAGAAVLEALVEDRDLDAEAAAAVAGGRPAPLPGSARHYGPRGPGRGWGLLWEAPFPLSASRKRGHLLLRSPGLRPVAAGDGRRIFAAGPDPQGKERLRSLLVDPAAPEPRRLLETWSLLPAPERVLDSAYLILDGRPALVVATMSAEEIALFEEKFLRVFFLDPDRSRLGLEPVLAAESRMNLWQPATFVASDVDRDGHDDLVVGYWKGLKEARIALDAHLGRPDGSFEADPAGTEFDVEGAGRSFVGYGADADGDGAPDLMVRAGAELLVFAGVPAPRKGKPLVEARPGWRIPVGGGAAPGDGGAELNLELGSGFGDFRIEPAPRAFGVPSAADLDGDGRPEVLLAETDLGGRGRVQVIRLAPRPGRW